MAEEQGDGASQVVVPGLLCEAVTMDNESVRRTKLAQEILLVSDRRRTRMRHDFKCIAPRPPEA